MRPLTISTCLIAVALLAPGTGRADDCKYTRPLDLDLDAAGATLLEVDAEAGFLVIEGERGRTRVVVEGVACASSEGMLKDIALDGGRRGDRLHVEAIIPDFDFSWRGYARLDLTVRVPDDLALRVRDGSGEIEIYRVASVELRDGSGAIDISEVYGDVGITDGSGEIEVRDVDGLVRVSDGSGGVVISGAGGGVHVEEDGSGELRITAVRGDVEIEEDGSGGITIRDVTGTVRVGSDGSGSIWVAQVSGGFELGSDGSGSVHVEDVSGTVKMP